MPAADMAVVEIMDVDGDPVMLDCTPDLDFLYYSNYMIGAGRLLWCLERQIDIPGRLGLAGFNGSELVQALPRQLATMNAERHQIGIEAAKSVASRAGARVAEGGQRVEREPEISFGDTLKRQRPEAPGGAGDVRAGS